MNVSIVGATAYTSLELIRYLVRHPVVDIVHLGGRREGNPPLSDVFPSLRGICDMRLSGLNPEDSPEEPDVAFFTLPHHVSHQYVPRYLDAGVRCIDFSADYRFRSLETYQAYYGEHADPGNLERAIYGIPELFRDDLAGAHLIANPGCYPTSVLLGLAPLVAHGLIDVSDIIVDAKSGVSGRGNKPSRGSMYCECNENMSPYKVGSHRHAPEMEQGMELLGQPGARVLFVPHLTPMDRGILSTIYVRLTQEGADEDLQQACEDYYADESFVQVLPAGEQPRTKDVSNTNYCHMAVTRLEGERAVIASCIDNLARGAASQAVQNMNVSLGLEENLGLT
jgi:N-acetyl-gamma-glutamyl-phosphate reductase